MIKVWSDGSEKIFTDYENFSLEQIYQRGACLHLGE